MRKRIIVLVMAALGVEIRLKNDFKNASIYSFMAIYIFSVHFIYGHFYFFCSWILLLIVKLAPIWTMFVEWALYFCADVTTIQPHWNKIFLFFLIQKTTFQLNIKASINWFQMWEIRFINIVFDCLCIDIVCLLSRILFYHL